MMQIRRCLRTRVRPLGVLLVIFVVISLFYFNQEQAHYLDRPQIIGLLVNTSGYALPEYNPWDPTLQKILVPGIEVDCTGGKHPLTSTTYLPQTNGSNQPHNGRQGHLVYHKEHEREHSLTKLSCCYQVITRGPSQSLKNYTEDTDSRYKLGPCIPIGHNVTLIKEAFIYVKCQNTLYFVVYRNVHHFIQPDYLNSIIIKKDLSRKLVKSQSSTNSKSSTSSKNSTNHKPLSVMLMGLDSTSRNNLQRYLPQTFAYLKESQAIDLLGYNKVGDNTFPNLLPLLSGLQEKALLKECTNGERRGPFDRCKFLWNNFSSHGYVTAFGEDSAPDGTFTYMKTGYVSPPTDFYLRPLITASEELVSYYTHKLQGMGWCLGYRSSTQIVYDFALEMLDLIHDVPSFSLFWSSRYTHDNLELPYAVDQSTKTFLEKASKRDDLILIFLSDHGMRFGDFRQTIIGKYEENIPYFYILLPQWFRKKYKKAYRALQENQKRLVAPQDIHETLLDILQEQYRNKEYLSVPHDIENSAMSLFKEIPKERNCDDALVPYNFCSGILYEDVYPNSPHIVKVAIYVLSFLNEGLLKFIDCDQLKLSKIIRARQGFVNLRAHQGAVNQKSVYSVTIMTTPGNAQLEANVVEINGKFELSGEISRINKYGLQSSCINNGQYRKYCFCRHLRYIPFMWNKSV